MKALLARIAPRHTRRRLLLLLARDFLRAPASLFRRLSRQNFANARVASRLTVACCVCGSTGGVFYDFPHPGLRKEHGIGMLRETLSCRNCGATMRDRQLAYGLLRELQRRADTHAGSLAEAGRLLDGSIRVLDTDSFGTINRVLRGARGYAHSQYVPSRANGSRLEDGSVNADLQNLPFADGSFDIVLSSDVMEHVLDDMAAYREIRRCLSARGVHVFTAPYDPCLAATRRLTLPAGHGNDVFVLEDHLHGDPHATAGIRAHRIYGQGFTGQLAGLGFEVEFLEIAEPARGIFHGDLFIATRRDS